MKMQETEGYQILRNLLDAFSKDTETILELFTMEAIVEYPYAKSLNIPHHLTMDDYRKHLNNILGNMPDIAFTGLHVYALQEEDGYWAEFHGATTVPHTGALYRQDYVVNFKLEYGKFSFYKEYWNVLPVLKALMSEEDAQRIIDTPIN